MGAPSNPGFGFSFGWKRRRWKAIEFAPGEQERLIAEAVAAGRVTKCAPALADGAETTQSAFACARKIEMAA